MSDLSLSSDEAYFGDNGEEFRGKILNSAKGRYALIEKIGYGAFSSVWLSYNVDKNEYNAIKIQNSEDYQDGKYEVKLLNKVKSLNNPNIITLIDDFIYTKVIKKKKIKKKGNRKYEKIETVCQKYVNPLKPLFY